MKSLNRLWLTTALMSALLLSACSGNEGLTTEGLAATAESIAETMVSARFTATARAATVTPTVTPTQATPTSGGPTPTPLAGDGPCLAVSLSDENVPDDSVMQAGETFTKTWVLTNLGNCTWTEEYSLVFHHGNSMEAIEAVALPGWVAPGQSVGLSLDMVAPSAPGSHIGFWSLRAPDGGLFGPSANGTFWVRITIPGPTPTSQVRTLGWSNAGAVRADGLLDDQIRSGDDTENQGWQGFLTFDFGNLADDSAITGVALYMTDDYLLSSDPFTSLGCLNVYLSYYGGVNSSDYDSYSGSPLWRFCNVNDLSGGAVYGSQAAIDAVQNALPSGLIQLALVFDNPTDADGINDHIIVDPYLAVTWYR